MVEQITPQQFREAEGVEDWRVVGDGACTFFRTGSFADAARFVRAMSGLSDLEEHRPDVDVRHDGVTVRLITMSDDYYGISMRDVELARQISAVAHDLGLSADPSAVQSVLVIPGAPDISDVIPFWRAALGYEPRIAAALIAGGRMVRDDFAPAWWTLADAAGNEADIATTMGRD
jgi:4a-hydroxytetrahydrobiopterin dehydratase